MNNEFSNVPVFGFCCGERTVDFCIYCLAQIGFKNIIKIEGQSSFYEKLIEFTQLAYNLDHEFYIRIDADRFVFKGMLQLISAHKQYNPEASHGYFFDCFMNKKRGGTPHIYSNLLIRKMHNKQVVIKNSNKPESNIMQQIESSRKYFDILTNLHDYEQYPSKIINTFINRLYRNHSGHYNWNEVCQRGFNSEVKEAFDYFNNNAHKSDCKYIQGYEKFNNKTALIPPETFPVLYQKYLKVYESKI